MMPGIEVRGNPPCFAGESAILISCPVEHHFEKASTDPRLPAKGNSGTLKSNPKAIWKAVRWEFVRGGVGVGWWASFNHIPVAIADPRADVVAIADLSEERLQKAGDAFGIEGCYCKVSDMLADEQLDGVMIATPHVAHAEAALPCSEAGLHVLIEKPMTTTVADAHAAGCVQRDQVHRRRVRSDREGQDRISPTRTGLTGPSACCRGQDRKPRLCARN